MIPTKPVHPAAPYLGGKRNLAKRLCSIIDATPHTTYAEPFVGMGGVFLRRSMQPRAEVINDISGDVVTLYRILQRHYQAFMDLLKWQLTSRAEFVRLVKVDPTTLTDLERAARFLYLQRTAFGGKVTGRNFGVSRGRPGAFNVAKLSATLEELHERLAGVVIEQLPYAHMIRRYDRGDTLFYLDPPYWNSEADYGAGTFERADFERLADQLENIEGRFILSINATPGAIATFSRFSIDTVDTTWSVSSGPSQKVQELIVTGGRAAA